MPTGDMREYAMGVSIATGAGLGMLLGLLMGNLMMGIALGAVAGLLVGALVQPPGTKEDKGNPRLAG